MLSCLGFVEREGRAVQDAAQGRWPDKEGVAEPNSQLRLKAALPLPSQSEVIKATRLRAGPTPTEPVLQSPLCPLGLNYLPLKAILILILENTPNQPGLVIHQK